MYLFFILSLRGNSREKKPENGLYFSENVNARKRYYTSIEEKRIVKIWRWGWFFIGRPFRSWMLYSLRELDISIPGEKKKMEISEKKSVEDRVLNNFFFIPEDHLKVTIYFGLNTLLDCESNAVLGEIGAIHYYKNQKTILKRNIWVSGRNLCFCL